MIKQHFVRVMSFLVVAVILALYSQQAQASPFISSQAAVNTDLFYCESTEHNSDGAKQSRYDGVTDKSIVKEVKDSITIHQHYPVFGNEAIDALIKKAVDAWIRDFEKRHVEDVKERKADGETEIPEWWHTGQYRIFESSPDCMTVVFSAFEFTGGVHGGHVHEVFTISRTSGKVLTLDDLFSSPDKALKILSARSKKIIAKKLKGAFLEEGLTSTRENFQLLIPLRDGVAVIFPEYQVAPYAAGIQSLTVPLSALKNAGPKAGIWK